MKVINLGHATDHARMMLDHVPLVELRCALFDIGFDSSQVKDDLFRYEYAVRADGQEKWLLNQRPRRDRSRNLFAVTILYLDGKTPKQNNTDWVEQRPEDEN